MAIRAQSCTYKTMAVSCFMLRAIRFCASFSQPFLRPEIADTLRSEQRIHAVIRRQEDRVSRPHSNRVLLAAEETLAIRRDAVLGPPRSRTAGRRGGRRG
jgi:hypothetical protein